MNGTMTNPKVPNTAYEWEIYEMQTEFESIVRWSE